MTSIRDIEPEHDQRLAGVRAAVEVTLYAVPELAGLADVEDLPVRVQHAVHARLCRQAGEKARQVEIGLGHGEILVDRQRARSMSA